MQEEKEEEFIDLDDYEDINLVAVAFVITALVVGMGGVLLLTTL